MFDPVALSVSRAGEDPLSGSDEVRESGSIRFSSNTIRSSIKCAGPLPIGTLALFSSMAATACVTVPPGELHPVEIAALEARLEASGPDSRVLTRLGMAYRSEGQSDNARAVLEEAMERQAGFMPAAYFLGLTYEELGEFGEAARLYERFTAVAGDDELARALAARLPFVRRMALEEQVRRTLAQERDLVNTDPTPNTVAVFPFLYLRGDPELAPLGTALADLLVGDLAQSDRLTVLERAHVQLLLEEMAIADRGLVDSRTAARSGFLLGASRIIQGQLGGGTDEILLDVTVAQVGRGELPVLPPIQERGGLDRLFELQEGLALQVFAALEVELTPAERERVAQRPTQNVQALLAYGLGLEAEDRADFTVAAREYARAAALDPGFQKAVEATERARNLEQASGTSVERLVEEVIEFDDWLTRRYAFRDLEGLVPVDGHRWPPEIFPPKLLPPGAGTRLIITLRRP